MPRLPPLPPRAGTDVEVEEVEPRAGGNALGGVDAELGRLLDGSPPRLLTAPALHIQDGVAQG